MLQLGDLLEEIATRTGEIEKNNDAREKSLAKNAVACKELRDEAYQDFKELIHTIETTHRWSKSETERMDLERLSVYIKEPVVKVRSIYRSNKTRRRKEKEQAAAQRYLISNELKERQQEQEKMNLPMIIYNH